MYTPKPQKQRSGLYTARIRVNGRDVTVSARTETACTRKAQEAKAKLLNERKTEKGTLGYFVDKYIEEYAPVLSPSSVRGYRSMRRCRFKRYMDMDIDRINWQQMISDETKVVSPKTVKCAWEFVKRALKTEAHLSPEVRLPQVPIKEIPYLQPEEIKPFCDALKGNIAEIPALLELHGLRRSEMMALQYSDIKDGVIHIHGAVVQDENGTFVRKPTNKNRSSSRTVPIVIPQLAEAIQGKSGKVMTIGINTLFNNIKRCCEIAGVTVVSNHGLRHSFASLAYHLGLSERQLMDLGGWADYATMHRIYIRLAQTDKSAAAERLMSFFQ